MTASKNQTTGKFSAETIGGESLTFYTTNVKLAISSNPVPDPYWQAIGTQTFPGQLPAREAIVSVYFPVGTLPDTYTLTENGDYRASYYRGSSDPKTYLATSGTLMLKVVPTEEIRDWRAASSSALNSKTVWKQSKSRMACST